MRLQMVCKMLSHGIHIPYSSMTPESSSCTLQYTEAVISANYVPAQENSTTKGCQFLKCG